MEVQPRRNEGLVGSFSDLITLKRSMMKHRILYQAIQMAVSTPIFQRGSRNAYQPKGLPESVADAILSGARNGVVFTFLNREQAISSSHRYTRHTDEE